MGVVIAQRLKEKINIIDAGVSPENYLDKIIKSDPSQVWIIDCLDFQAKPGEWTIFRPEDLVDKHLFFTHNCSLELLCDYLKKNIKADIFILGIQPESTKFGQGLSKEVEAALPKIEKRLINLHTQNEGKLRRR